MAMYELSGLVMDSLYGDGGLKNYAVTDDTDAASMMVYIPRFYISDVIDGGSEKTHPAFIINGEAISGLYFSKFSNFVYKDKAYSVPGEDPGGDGRGELVNAIAYCADKGLGWHIMTNIEWGAIALLCEKNGFLPYGNNDNGKDTRETEQRALSVLDAVKSDGTVTRTKTGTGRVTYAHNGASDGIYDLNGDVNEVVIGARLVNGELQVLEDNNAADPENATKDGSAQWKAIDGETGAYVEPDGEGTTAGAIRLAWDSDHWQWTTGDVTAQSVTECAYNAVTAADGVSDAAKEILYLHALLPLDSSSDYDGAKVSWTNEGTTAAFLRGGDYQSGSGGGVFSSTVMQDEELTENIGFRAAYYIAQ